MLLGLQIEPLELSGRKTPELQPLLSPVVNTFWKGVAWAVSRKPVADWLIARSQKTAYFHLPGYMDRFWLFNRYSEIDSATVVPKRFSWLPSIRIHHILREDYARDMHDHPWDARTIILRGEYTEERMLSYESREIPQGLLEYVEVQKYHRKSGDTATLNFGEYHNITRVSEGGVWTMFFTYNYRGTWGFWVNGKKVPHREYENGGAA